MRVLQAARGTALTEHSPRAPGPSERRARRTGLLTVVAVLALALDVGTKVLVVSELEGRRTFELLGDQLLIRVSRNSGAAFSFAEGYTIVFTAVAIGVVIAIIRLSRRLASSLWAVSLGLLLAGATGNLLDRLFRSPGPGRGAVVDFLDFQVFPSFNVADSAITVGAVLAVLASFRGIEVDGSHSSRGEGDSSRGDRDA